MMVVDIWKTTPFVAIIILAGLVMLPQDLYEAAEVDGASSWTTFWRITFPLLRPTIALAVLFRVLQAFGLFDLPQVLTSGGPGHATTSLAILGYQAMFQNLSFGPGVRCQAPGADEGRGEPHPAHAQRVHHLRHPRPGRSHDDRDRVAVMSLGHLQQVDKLQARYEKPDNLFVAAFIGSPVTDLYRASLSLEVVWDSA